MIEACLHNKPEKRPKISEVCMAFKNLKANTDKQVPFATANAIELYEEVRHGDQQKRNIEAHVATLETTIFKLETDIKAKDQQLQQCHLQLLAAEKARVAEVDKQQPRKTYLQMQSKSVSQPQKQVYV